MEVLAHQGQFVGLGAIFTESYITQMIRGMGLIEHTQGMTVVGTIALLGMQTLAYIGIVERRGGIYRLAQCQGTNVQDPGPSHEANLASQSESKSEPDQESKEHRPSLEARFEEFRSEVYQQLQVFKRGHKKTSRVTESH